MENGSLTKTSSSTGVEVVGMSVEKMSTKEDSDNGPAKTARSE